MNTSAQTVAQLRLQNGVKDHMDRKRKLDLHELMDGNYSNLAVLVYVTPVAFDGPRRIKREI